MKHNPFDILNMLKKKENPFRELTREEKEKQRQTEKEVKDDIARLGRVCNDILIDQRYREFADLFRDIEAKLTALLIDCDEEDRDLFYLKMKTYQFKLRIFRQILALPHDFVEKATEVNRTEVK